MVHTHLIASLFYYLKLKINAFGCVILIFRYRSKHASLHQICITIKSTNLRVLSHIYSR